MTLSYLKSFLFSVSHNFLFTIYLDIDFLYCIVTTCLLVLSDQPTVQDYSVSALELYKYLMDAHMTVILMDMRSTADYDNSHIQHKLCINVPADIVIPG